MEDWPNYELDHFELSHLSRRVRTVHICAYENVGNEGDGDIPPTNHWGAFLQIGQDRSVRVDMAADYGYDGRRGKIHISSKSYSHTNHDVMTLSFDLQQTRTVQQIFELINNNGRDRYRFTEEIEGCRYWIWVFICDLQAAGIINADSGDRTWAAVSFYWKYPQGSGSDPREVKPGQFYVTYPQGPEDDDEVQDSDDDDDDDSDGDDSDGEDEDDDSDDEDDRRMEALRRAMARARVSVR
jgi:hypothetical protein